MFLRRLLCLSITISFVATSVIPPQRAYAQTILNLPQPGTMVSLSPAYTPLLIKGLKINPHNPLSLDFIVSPGNSQLTAQDPQLKIEAERLIKYFFAGLTLPEKDMWVNLSPYEKDRIIPKATGETEMGRDMLAQDYILKQITASLIYPEKGLGKDFWNKVYTEAYQRFGTTQIPVNTFNKVWIVANKASVYEAKDTVFVVDSHLKVMLEEDYLAKQKHQVSVRNDASSVGANIIREIVLPALEKEVNEGKNFAPLRQVFHSLILAKWYKETLKTALLNQVYSNKNKIAGVDVADKGIKDKIYQQYLMAYKKGVFNYIREDINQATQQPLPRKYFSGGEVLQFTEQRFNSGTATADIKSKVQNLAMTSLIMIGVAATNAAMTTVEVGPVIQLPGDDNPEERDRLNRQLDAVIEIAVNTYKYKKPQPPQKDSLRTFFTEGTLDLKKAAERITFEGKDQKDTLALMLILRERVRPGTYESFQGNNAPLWKRAEDVFVRSLKERSIKEEHVIQALNGIVPKTADFDYGKYFLDILNSIRNRYDAIAPELDLFTMPVEPGAGKTAVPTAVPIAGAATMFITRPKGALATVPQLKLVYPLVGEFLKGVGIKEQEEVGFFVADQITPQNFPLAKARILGSGDRQERLELLATLWTLTHASNEAFNKFPKTDLLSLFAARLKGSFKKRRDDPNYTAEKAATETNTTEHTETVDPIRLVLVQTAWAKVEEFSQMFGVSTAADATTASATSAQKPAAWAPSINVYQSKVRIIKTEYAPYIPPASDGTFTEEEKFLESTNFLVKTQGQTYTIEINGITSYIAHKTGGSNIRTIGRISFEGEKAEVEKIAKALREIKSKRLREDALNDLSPENVFRFYARIAARIAETGTDNTLGVPVVVDGADTAAEMTAALNSQPIDMQLVYKDPGENTLRLYHYANPPEFEFLDFPAEKRVKTGTPEEFAESKKAGKGETVEVTFSQAGVISSIREFPGNIIPDRKAIVEQRGYKIIPKTDAAMEAESVVVTEEPALPPADIWAKATINGSWDRLQGKFDTIGEYSYPAAHVYAALQSFKQEVTPPLSIIEPLRWSLSKRRGLQAWDPKMISDHPYYLYILAYIARYLAQETGLEFEPADYNTISAKNLPRFYLPKNDPRDANTAFIEATKKMRELIDEWQQKIDPEAATEPAAASNHSANGHPARTYPVPHVESTVHHQEPQAKPVGVVSYAVVPTRILKVELPVGYQTTPKAPAAGVTITLPTGAVLTSSLKKETRSLKNQTITLLSVGQEVDVINYSAKPTQGVKVQLAELNGFLYIAGIALKTKPDELKANPDALQIAVAGGLVFIKDGDEMKIYSLDNSNQLVAIAYSHFKETVDALVEAQVGFLPKEDENAIGGVTKISIRANGSVGSHLVLTDHKGMEVEFPAWQLHKNLFDYDYAHIDHAMNAFPGGIDLNTSKIDIQRQGSGMDIQFDPAMVARFKVGNFDGIAPVITGITPITDNYTLLGLKEPEVSGQLAA